MELVYKDKDIRNIILNLAQKHRQIIHGQQSTNIQLPQHLRRDTTDYDIYTKKAKFMADKLVEELNKEHGKNYYVEPAVHKGTFKVKDWEGHTIADYTEHIGRNPKTTNILGIHYTKPSYSEYKLKKLIKDEKNKFRNEKDLNTLNKIKQYKKIKVW